MTHAAAKGASRKMGKSILALAAALLTGAIAMADTAALQKAKKAKNDEFYTQYADIQMEVNAYLEYNPDTFRGKTVLLPCDDPEESNYMTTKIMIIIGVSVGSVLALFVMGYFLDKKSRDNEQGAASPDGKDQSDEK